MKRFDLVEATFQPANMDTLKEEAVPWIGWRGQWSADWIIEEGEFKGTFAMGVDANDERPPFAWAPEADLADVELIKSMEVYA